MSDNEKKYYMNIQAGANQSQNLAALMRNYNTALEATATAENSAGSAARENARYMDSMEGKLQNLKSAWEKLSYKLINSDDLKKAIDGLTKALDYLSSDEGMKLINFAKELAIVFAGFKIASSASGWLSSFGAAAGGAGEAAGSATPLIQGLASIFGAGGIGWGLLGGAGVVAGLIALNENLDPENRYQETTEKLKDLKDKIKEYGDEYKNLLDKQNSGKDLTAGEQQRLDWLKQQLDVLKEQEKVYKKLQHEQFHDKAMKPDKKQTAKEGGAKSVTKGAGGGGTIGDADQQIKATNALTSKLKEYNDVGNRASQISKKMTEAQQELNAARRRGDTEGEAKALEKIAQYNEEYAKTTNKLSPSMKNLKKEMKSWIDEAGSFDKMDGDMQKAYKSAEKIVKAYDRLKKTGKEIGDKPLSKALKPEELKQLTKDLTTMGTSFGIVKNKAGEVENIDFAKFDASLQEAGYSSDQIREALHQITNENPEATVTINGTEVAQKDVNTVLDYLDALDSNDPEATVNVNGTDIAVKDIGNVEHLLTLLNGSDYTTNVKASGVDEAKDKVQSFEGSVENLPLQHDTKITTSNTGKSKKQADSVGKSVDGIAKKHNTHITASGTSNAEKKIRGVRDELSGLPSYKSVTISIGVSGAKAAKDAVSNLPGHAQGARHADAGLSEVNEAGFEFIRDAKTGKLRIAGGGKRTVTHLNEGDIVYTHEESKRMMSDNADIEIPQHESGKGKKQKKYNEAREKVKDKYERKKEETEHKSKVRHWTDKQLQKQKEKDLRQYKKNVDKENKKWSGVKKKGVEREEKYEVREGRADVDHDRWAQKIEKAIEKLSNSGERSKKSKEYKDAQKVINQAKDKKHISGDERRDYLDEINGIIKSNVTEGADRKIEKAIDAYENYGSTYKDAVAVINNEYKKHHITKAEKAEYIRKLKEVAADKKSDKSKSEIEKAIETVKESGDTKEAEAKITEAFKARKITSEEKKSYLEALNEAQKDFEERAYSKIMSGVSEAQTSAQARQALASATAKVTEMYNSGLITAEEREDYLADIASQTKELDKHEAERALSGMMEGLSKGGSLKDVQDKVADMYKKGLITEEEKEDYLKEATEAAQEYKHEQATKAIETLMSGVRGTNADFAKIKQQIEAESKAGNISAEEREQYLKEAYKQNLDYNMKLFASNKKTYKDMRATLEDYYKQGMLTAAEYYEYLESLMQEQLAQQQKALEKMQTNNSNAYSLAQAYVNKQIKALQEDNEELDKQNELLELQANLEKAKNQKVKIYREGVGFVYEQNTEAIEEATKALQDFHKAEKSPELQKWEAISDLFGELEEEANMRDLEVRLGTTAQGLVGGLGTDVDKWTAWIKNNLATGLGYTSILEAMGELTTAEDIDAFLSGTDDTLAQSYIDSMINQNRFASGTLSARGGFARVAENGYEIALLGKGDAVMPHNVSKNLMEWGQYSPKDFVEHSGDTVQQYSFDKLVLPNVENAHDFIRELQNLPNKALQFGTSRGY